MENKKPLYAILAISAFFSFWAIITDLEFIPPAKHDLYIAGRVTWGVLNIIWSMLLYFNLMKIKNVVLGYLITMMLYSFHGQWFVPCYYLGFVEIVLVIGLFFPIDKKLFRVVSILSCLLMCWVILVSPATYHESNELINTKFRYDAVTAVILITIGSLLGHTYVTVKRQEKDEAYRKFLDIGKYSSFLFHDFKGLLSTPIFYADMLNSTIQTGKSSQEVIFKLNEDLSFIQQYSKEIMKLTLPDNNSYNSKGKINVDEVKNTLNILLRKPLAGIDFSITVNGVPDKEVNSYKLVKVFYNAVLNSLESIKSNNVSQPKISITFNKNSVEIRDNGTGFPSDILKKLNQEEVKVSTKDGGSGIGTAIIKDLVKHMDGKVNFYNDNGAVVSITI